MTGPTGADQQTPGDLDVETALAEQRRLYSRREQAEVAELEDRVARHQARLDHPDLPPYRR